MNLIFKNSEPRDEFISGLNDNGEKMKETLLDILNNDIGKIEIAHRKLWITQAIILKN